MDTWRRPHMGWMGDPGIAGVQDVSLRTKKDGVHASLVLREPRDAGVVVAAMVVVVAAALTMSVVAVGPVRIPLPDRPNPSRKSRLNRLPSRRWSRWWSQKPPPATTPKPKQPRPD